MKQGLGFIHLFCLASGAMISSGIFILPGLAFERAGPSVIIAYGLAGLLALVGILSVAELATAMPRAGGDYYFVTRGLGPLVGTVSGILSWFALSLKTSFAIFGISEVIYLFTGFPILLIALPICLAFTVLNIIGVKGAARLEVGLVGGLLALMALYFFIGLGPVRMENFTPAFPRGLNAMLSTAGFVFVSFGGLLNVATVAEEVKNPQKNIPLAFISSVIVITLAYCGLLYVTVGILSPDRLSGSMTPLADTARILAGPAGYLVITVAALLAFVTTANAGIMSASRYPLALSRDKLIPPFFRRVSQRFGTPVTSVAVTGTVIFLTLLLDLELLVKAASTVVLTTYALAGIAVIVLRQSGLKNYRPTFRVPGYPWLPGFGILLFLFLIADMGPATIEISLSLVALGLLIYFLYGRKRTGQESALLHLVERITSKDLTSYSLEEELKGIIWERDRPVDDRFDLAVHGAPILDLDESKNRKVFFRLASEKLAEKISCDPEFILELLVRREEESSTALSDFVAVPHLVIEREGIFELLLARSRTGIRWSTEAPVVKAVFVICGSRNLRNLHLKALAAIAQIVQQPDFEEEWLRVKHPAQLRDILLLTARKRV